MLDLNNATLLHTKKGKQQRSRICHSLSSWKDKTTFTAAEITKVPIRLKTVDYDVIKDLDAAYQRRTLNQLFSAVLDDLAFNTPHIENYLNTPIIGENSIMQLRELNIIHDEVFCYFVLRGWHPLVVEYEVPHQSFIRINVDKT